ncbi:Pef1p [Sporobolomyces salmoneus]|uniref:Pef1p n=1 Tax=Sporobolomyces salmoneus TaxID=183962 RepID=UPI00317A6326
MPLFSKTSPSKPTQPPAASPYPPAHTLNSSQPPPQHYQQTPSMQYNQQAQGGGYPPVGSQGGYQGHAQSSEPPLRAWFDAVDLDRSGFITQIELKQALVNGDWQPFDDQTVSMLMRLFDVDGSGTIGFGEFQGLWNYIKEWQNVFRQFDRDRSGTIEPAELANALSTFGYNLSPQLINLLQRKFNPPTAVHKPAQGYGNYARPPANPQGITFDRFVRCCVTVRQLSESFKGVDTDRDGWVNISYETFMTLVLSAP